jgi:hypothetical protein
MAENITINSTKNRMGLFSKIPYPILLIVYLLAAHYTNIDMHGVAGYVFIGICVIVLIVEFFKSGDISTAYFFSDIVFAVLAVALSTGLLSYLLFELGETPSFYHWLGYAVIIVDAVLSPFNSFRTALRNFGVGS